MRAARPSFVRPCIVLVAVAAFTRLWTPVHAQVDLYSLEAAYIYNFTEFTEWPPARAGSALVVCVNPHTALGATLAKLEGRLVSGKAWSVKPIPDGAAIAGCSVLIVDDAASSAAARAASGRDVPMLVVRAAESDASDGAYVVTLVRDGDRLRFDIDNKEAVRRHLALSSKLLRLARNVS
ncbi:YfiR family protein [Trinickia sp.]|uniref:YfiR family protein n=1 Tax=Trinickia sp. TaxID=2571163 RepID=UPI003F7E94F3